jgi:hypothetical protein
MDKTSWILLLILVVGTLAAGALVMNGRMPQTLFQSSVKPFDEPQAITPPSPTPGGGVPYGTTSVSGQNQPQPGATDTGAEAAARLEQDWATITTDNVQRACLAESKRQAKAMGYDEGVVFDCACTSRESAEVKSYDCQVSALDGRHPASIVCTKSLQVCDITSAQGKVRYTFQQLQAMVTN